MIKKELVNKFVNILVVLSSFLLLLNISLKVQAFINHQKYSSFFGFSIFEVTTGSMAGSVEMGDFILIKNTKNIKLNDIVTFKENDHFVTHRVVQLYDDKIITKGDSNNTNDVPITRKVIIGKVVKVFPKVGIMRTLLLDYKILIPLTVLFLQLLSLLDKKFGSKKFSIQDLTNFSFSNNNDKSESEISSDDNIEGDFTNGVDLSKIVVDNVSIDLDDKDLKNIESSKISHNKLSKKVVLIPLNKRKVRLIPLKK